MPKALKYQLTAEFIRKLEAERSRLGIDQYQRVQDLLSRLPDDILPEQLKLTLIPLFARSSAEQEQFYALFDQCIEQIAAVNTSQASSDVPEKGEQQERRLQWALWVVGLLLLGAVVAWLHFSQSPIEPETFYQTHIVSADETTTICPDTLAGFGAISATENCLGERTGSSVYGSYDLSANACLDYIAHDSVGRDSLCLNIRNADGREAVLFLSIQIERPSVDSSTTPNLPTETTETTEPIILFPPKPYPHATDIRNLLAPQPTKAQLFFKEQQYWLRPFLIGLLSLFFYLLLQWRHRRRQKLAAARTSGDRPPYSWKIELPGTAEGVDLGENYQLLLNQLRRRTADDFQRVDLPRTIDATIEGAGLPALRYAQQTRPPEYLLLIDRHSAQNHRAQLFDLLYHAFRTQNVIIERFFYDGDPRVVYQDSSARLQLADLHHQFPNARLLLVGNGYQLLSPLTGKPAKWTRALTTWSQRTLLSPRPTQSWGNREHQLNALLPVLPASLQSLHFLIDQFDAQEDPQWDYWHEIVQDALSKPILFEEGLMHTLQQHYSERIVQWIAACAVYPALHWDLTLYLGRLLSDEEENLLSVGNLLDLNRLPWFIEGAIPHDARTVLIAYLETEAPALLEKVRLNLHQVLLQNPPPVDSVAYDDFQMSLALNEWQSTRDTKRKKGLEKQITKLLEQGIEADFTMLKYLKKERSILDFIVPDQWKKFVHPEGFPALGWKAAAQDFWWASLLWLVLVALVVLIPVRGEECHGETVFYSEILNAKSLAFNRIVNQAPILINNSTDPLVLCLNNAEDLVLYYEFLVHDSISYSNGLDVVDSLTRLVEASSAMDSVKRIFRENVAVSLYNIGSYFFEESSNSFAIAGLNEEESSILKSRLVCPYFERAAELNPNDADMIERTVMCKTEIPASENIDESLNNTAEIATNCTLPPVSFRIIDSVSCVPAEVRIQNTVNDVNGLIDFYVINWGDNTIDTVSSSPVWTHTYVDQSCTVYRSIMVRAYANCPETGMISRYALERAFVGQGPSASFSLPAASFCTGQPIQIRNTSCPENPGWTTAIWNFGDGESSNEWSPTHTYARQGDYQVTLIASNPCGIDTISQTVTVNCELDLQDTKINLSSQENRALSEGIIEIETLGQKNVYNIDRIRTQTFSLPRNIPITITVITSIHAPYKKTFTLDSSSSDISIQLNPWPEELSELTLYFDNDSPHPHTRRITSDSNYIDVYQRFYQKKDLYRTQFGVDASDFLESMNLEAFFEQELRANAERLPVFADTLLAYLQKGFSFYLEMNGCSSPRFNDAGNVRQRTYNEALTERRIDSVVNFFEEYRQKPGAPLAFENYLGGQLRMVTVQRSCQVADREELSNLSDLKNSIYSIDGAVSRRVQVKATVRTAPSVPSRRDLD